MGYWIRTKTGKKGPFVLEQLRTLAAAGKVPLSLRVIEDATGEPVVISDLLAGEAEEAQEVDEAQEADEAPAPIDWVFPATQEAAAEDSEANPGDGQDPPEEGDSGIDWDFPGSRGAEDDGSGLGGSSSGGRSSSGGSTRGNGSSRDLRSRGALSAGSRSGGGTLPGRTLAGRAAAGEGLVHGRRLSSSMRHEPDLDRASRGGGRLGSAARGRTRSAVARGRDLEDLRGAGRGRLQGGRSLSTQTVVLIAIGCVLVLGVGGYFAWPLVFGRSIEGNWAMDVDAMVQEKMKDNPIAGMSAAEMEAAKGLVKGLAEAVGSQFEFVITKDKLQVRGGALTKDIPEAAMTYTRRDLGGGRHEFSGTKPNGQPDVLTASFRGGVLWIEGPGRSFPLRRK